MDIHGEKFLKIEIIIFMSTLHQNIQIIVETYLRKKPNNDNFEVLVLTHLDGLMITWHHKFCHCYLELQYDVYDNKFHSMIPFSQNY